MYMLYQGNHGTTAVSPEGFVDLNLDMIHAPMNMVPGVVYENDAKTRILSAEYYIWHLLLQMPLRLLRLLPQTHRRPIYRSITIIDRTHLLYNPNCLPIFSLSNHPLQSSNEANARSDQPHLQGHPRNTHKLDGLGPYPSSGCFQPPGSLILRANLHDPRVPVVAVARRGSELIWRGGGAR